MDREIYLDNSATTRPFDEVIEYMGLINKTVYGNPSSLHLKGIEAEKHVRKSREAIAKTLDIIPKELIFTSGGTESNNMAVIGYLRANPRKGKHVITTKIEHPSILEVFRYLETLGYLVDYIDVDRNGIVNLNMLKEKISDDTALVSVMYVNNEVGSIQPIDEIAKTIKGRNKNTAFHVDAVQAYGKLKLNPKKSGIDLMSISSHKIHGPKGVGALFVRESVKIEPILFGGGQESLLRSGTENVPGICGFGLAAEMIHSKLDENYEKVAGLKNLFIELLEMNIEGFTVISPENSSPYIINVSFDNLKAEVLLHHLEEKGIFVSTGSACSSRKKKYSHVLEAMGIKSDSLEGALRFSLCGQNSERDIIETVDALKEIIPRIRIKKFGR